MTRRKHSNGQLKPLEDSMSPTARQLRQAKINARRTTAQDLYAVMHMALLPSINPKTGKPRGFWLRLKWILVGR